HLDGQLRRVQSPLLGRFNVDTLLLVAGVLHALGHGVDAIADALGRLQPIPGRMNRLGGGDRPLVVIDYSHKPDPLEQALESLRGHLRGRLVCVFGCGGERDTGKRPQMAAIAERLADEVVVTDDNPRGEDGDAIVAGIIAGFADPQRVRVQRDRRSAIIDAIAHARAGDIVLIAGKGHESYQEVAGVQHPFDDSVIAREALEGAARFPCRSRASRSGPRAGWWAKTCRSMRSRPTRARSTPAMGAQRCSSRSGAATSTGMRTSQTPLRVARAPRWSRASSMWRCRRSWSPIPNMRWARW